MKTYKQLADSDAMYAAAKESRAHSELAANEAKPLADVVLPGTSDFRSQEATILGMRYVFGPGALAYTDHALKVFCGGEPEARALIERHPVGVTIVTYWE